ncbi:F-box protein At1g67340-like [Setaria viridis]|uniref:F-box protein At1g67340-like n=1 Tax=Setaria viridis TaxID=4556 RepID=UPI003B3AE404
MAPRRPCRSLSDLPIEMVIDIIGHLAATSDNPLEELRRLWATCRLMLSVCDDRAVGVRLSFLQCWEKMSWSQSSRMHALLHQLVALGNLEACLSIAMKDFFGKRGPLQLFLHQLSRGTVSGLNVAAYLYALFLYRNDGGAADDDIARMYIRRVEGEGEDGAATRVSTGPMKLGNLGFRERREVYNYMWSYTWCKRSDPLPPAPVCGDFPCVGGTCGKAKG